MNEHERESKNEYINLCLEYLRGSREAERQWMGGREAAETHP